MASEFYSQDVYGRTMESMLIEWDVHNSLYYDFWKHPRLGSTDFDKNSEGWTKWDFYRFAIVEGSKEVFGEIFNN